MYPVIFEIEPVTVYSQGVCWALGAVVADWIVRLDLRCYSYDSEPPAAL